MKDRDDLSGPSARTDLDCVVDKLDRGVILVGPATKAAATLETWTYRAAMIAGGILLVPWIPPLLGEKPIWEISYGGAYALAAVMLVGLLLTWWARIYLGPLWSSVISRKEGHRS